MNSACKRRNKNVNKEVGGERGGNNSPGSIARFVFVFRDYSNRADRLCTGNYTAYEIIASVSKVHNFATIAPMRSIIRNVGQMYVASHGNRLFDF